MLRQAENARERDLGRRAIVMPAREAAQTAEDARLIALQRQDDERISKARRPPPTAKPTRLRWPNPNRGGELAESERAAADRRRLEAEAAADRAVRERASAEAALSAAQRAKPKRSALNSGWQMSVPPQRPRVRRHKRPQRKHARPSRGRDREGRSARTAAASVEHHPRDQGDGARPDRQRLGRVVRHGPARSSRARARSSRPWPASCSRIQT